jgi:hypothetical protein
VLKSPALLRSAFAKNLRWLCDGQPSIASVCRDTGINRQQFNRYLAGTAIPSAQVMRVICMKFSVAEASMFLPNEELKHLVGMDRSADDITRLLGAIGARKPDKLKPGFYFRYEPVHRVNGPHLLRTLYFVQDNERNFSFRARRRLVDNGAKASGNDCHRLTGTILKISNYLYFFEIRLPATDELSFAVFGNASGINHLRSGMVFHQKHAKRAALEYIGEAVNVRQLLKRCGYITLDEPGIDAALLDLLLPDHKSPGVLEAAQ